MRNKPHAYVKIARHGNSAMCSIPRDILYQIDCMFGDYILMELNEDGTLTLSKAEISRNVSHGRVLRARDVPPAVTP